MAEHLFHLTAKWPGGRNDVGTIEAGQLKTRVSIPPEMDGPGIGTNPDEMLLGAAATCYIITLAAMMERSKLEKDQLEMESVGVVDVTNGVITYKKIIHKPHIILKLGATDKEIALAQRLAEKAENSCMISRAIQGNVSVELVTNIEIAK
ncbi:OsmC family protein [Sporosarcina pasteurii]|uniref:Peroxiredoxin, SACOL1771 subfamily n=1 Tax=Sporosarcina pasteurii TaxID=1474 RepID=A0A380C720_SPOPA|nr:OsmC family protein [Sporosarcina pasteurii]MDS9473055.1 OsmC family protein [Sporosarcina pasteurii]QBQ04562.1 OsmC family peroxiredoxin [Sporosarcina pasteurii]SUJ14170.1 peroxiredoxin, SACOL1771 subfamily [Sporosarcina pasteurii]